MPGGRVNVISANEAYPSFEVDLQQAENGVQMIGKVVWFGRYV